ncbi:MULTISPECIES: hypothetical protein [unclassified Synechocystis]|uniref:hypothetical protein n=1 Tax=unclassified Synechocystis TaxID=2640012 RepID=UPI000401DFB0|nr:MULTISPECIES: hypothetical protein [unclassified Synechocystis]AIE74405.1 hypothetical protein D082_18770 [Synechocystis sp. PCC 6714]MCT0254823.1 hypothetical protein [Synechocystis sp. CS-94]
MVTAISSCPQGTNCIKKVYGIMLLGENLPVEGLPTDRQGEMPLLFHKVLLQ